MLQGKLAQKQSVILVKLHPVFFFFFGVVNTFAMGQDKLQHKMFLKLERQIAVL